MSTAYLSLGSNIGDKEGNIEKAIQLLSSIGRIIKTSDLYLTEPVDYKKQDWFLNCIIALETDYDPHKLLEEIGSIESQMGRVRMIRYGPRVIDIDILFYDDRIVEDERLTIPHPRLHKRGFILRGMVDVNPDLMHPLLGKTVRELYKECEDKSMVKIHKKQREVKINNEV
ncbi:MAG: 2-amino-4-hydroxy-6-hydroxymethyldihydropteridine diphosphokinase [Candidatus Thermoplasmatota archaeon]